MVITVVVISLLSLDDMMHDEHMHFSKDDPRHNFLTANMEGLLCYLVEHFAPPKSGTVLNLTALQGTIYYLYYGISVFITEKAIV